MIIYNLELVFLKQKWFDCLRGKLGVIFTNAGRDAPRSHMTMGQYILPLRYW